MYLRVDANVNSELGVVGVNVESLIFFFPHCAVGNRREETCGGGWIGDKEILHSLYQFHCDPKVTLRNKVWRAKGQEPSWLLSY